MDITMDKLIFSQTGVYRLQQLANQYHGIFGERYKLSDTDSMLALLRKSARCQDKVIKAYFTAFTSELDDRLIERLAEHGIPAKPVTH